jgi:hypothetical protein
MVASAAVALSSAVMRHGCLALVLVLLAMSPRSSIAQTASVPVQLAGTWALDGDESRSIRVIDAAFQPSLDRLPDFMHGYARGRIRDDMSPPRTVVVALNGPQVDVRFQGVHPRTIVGNLGAHATTATGVDDGTVVTPRITSGWLELHYVGDGSEMRQLLSTEADGNHMHLDFAITSPQLVGTVRYRLEYARRP